MKKLKVLSIFWHSVEPDSIDPEFLAGWNPTASLFREQIKFLTDHYNPISIREFMELTEDPSRLRVYKKPPVLLSFDDGFKNVIDQALPILNDFGSPAVFFVIGEILRNPGFLPWYVERNYLVRKTRKESVVYENASLDLTSKAGRKELILLFAASFKMCRLDSDRERSLSNFAELLDVHRPAPRDLDQDLRFVDKHDLAGLGSSSLLTVASHAMTHRFLDGLSYDEQFNEMQQSHTLLSMASPSYFPALAYPGGAFNADTIVAAERVYKCAFAGFSGASYRNKCAYPRIGIGRDTTSQLSYSISRRRLRYVLPLKRLLGVSGVWRSR
jgi:peptidoglycan/xylan/chitin deacetylase (PgdA/CDA1 family)